MGITSAKFRTLYLVARGTLRGTVGMTLLSAKRSLGWARTRLAYRAIVEWPRQFARPIPKGPKVTQRYVIKRHVTHANTEQRLRRIRYSVTRGTQINARWSLDLRSQTFLPTVAVSNGKLVKHDWWWEFYVSVPVSINRHLNKMSFTKQQFSSESMATGIKKEFIPGAVEICEAMDSFKRGCKIATTYSGQKENTRWGHI